MAMSRFWKLLRSYGRSEKGIAAVEFALISPVLLLMMLGAVEAGRATVLARRFDLVTHMVADLVSRGEQTGSFVTISGDMTPISQAVQLVWAPYSMATLKFQILQVRAANTGSTKLAAGMTYVDWSYSFFGATVPSQCSLYTMPANLVANGNGMIVVNSTYTYTPLLAINPVSRPPHR